MGSFLAAKWLPASEELHLCTQSYSGNIYADWAQRTHNNCVLGLNNYLNLSTSFVSSQCCSESYIEHLLHRAIRWRRKHQDLRLMMLFRFN